MGLGRGAGVEYGITRNWSLGRVRPCRSRHSPRDADRSRWTDVAFDQRQQLPILKLGISYCFGPAEGFLQ
jgi:hypothetical protein